MNNQHPELLHRHKLNPILTAANWPYPVNSVFNPGTTLLLDGTTLLLCRVEDRRGHSHLCAARSANGVDGWQIDPPEIKVSCDSAPPLTLTVRPRPVKEPSAPELQRRRL